MGNSLFDRLQYNKSLTKEYDEGKISYDYYSSHYKTVTQREIDEANRKASKRRGYKYAQMQAYYTKKAPLQQIQDPQGNTFSGQVVQTQALNQGAPTFLGVREVTPQEQAQRAAQQVRAQSARDAGLRGQYNLRKPELKNMSYAEFKERAQSKAEIQRPSQDHYTKKYGSETERRNLFSKRNIQTTPEQRYIRAGIGANVEYQAVQMKKQNSGVFANTISKAEKMPSFLDRMIKDSDSRLPASKTLLRESEYYSDILDYKSVASFNKGNRAESLLYNMARIPLEGVYYFYENPVRTFGLLALGVASAGAPAVIGGAFPRLAPFVSNIAQGVSSIGGALYVPFVAKEISETGDIPKYFAQTTTQLSLIKAGSILTEPRYETSNIYSDSATKTRRYASDKQVTDVAKIKSEFSVKSQYSTQTYKMTGTETQRARLNPYASEQILTKSNYNINGEIVTEPQGASKLLRSFFTNKAPSPTLFNVRGSSTGTLNILKSGYVEGITQVRQKVYTGEKKVTGTKQLNSKQYAEYLAKKGDIKDLKEVEMWDNDGVYTPEIKRMRIDNKLQGDDLLRAYSHELVHYNLGEKGLYKVTKFFLKSKNPIANKVGEKLIDFEESIAFKNENARAQYNVNVEKKVYSDKSISYVESFYKASPNKYGLMQFSGSKSSSLGGSYDFRGEELFKRSVLQVDSQEVYFSSIRGAEKGFLNDKFNYQPQIKKSVWVSVSEYNRFKPIKNGNTQSGSNAARATTTTTTTKSTFKPLSFISSFSPLSISQSKTASANLIFSNGQMTKTSSGIISESKTASSQPQKSEYKAQIISNSLINAKSSVSIKQAPNQRYKAFNTQKTYQAPKSELLNLQRQIQSPKMELMGKQEATTKLNSSLMQEQTSRTITASKTVTKSKVVSKSALKTTALSKIYNLNKGFSTNPPYSPPLLPPTSVNFGVLKSKKNKGNTKDTFLSSGKQYRPTVYSAFNEIFSSKKSLIGEKSGLGIRPILRAGAM
jgi:hypothetical protein